MRIIIHWLIVCEININFFSKEMMELIQRKLFSNGMPVLSTVALNDQDFVMAGELMAMSVVQGGPAPSFLSKSVYAYITNKPLAISGNDPDSKHTEAALKVKVITLELSIRSRINSLMIFRTEKIALMYIIKFLEALTEFIPQQYQKCSITANFSTINIVFLFVCANFSFIDTSGGTIMETRLY